MPAVQCLSPSVPTPHPQNPRPRLTEAEVAEFRASIEAHGQKQAPRRPPPRRERPEGALPPRPSHTHAMSLLSGGGAVKDLQRQLGHRDQAKINRYADLVDERRRKTIFSLLFGTP